VDITFGGFLRGIITADLDFAPDERDSFRLVFIEAFREWGIYPRGVSSMGADALAWPSGEELMQELIADGSMYHLPADLREHLKPFVLDAARNWNLESDRFEVWKDLDRLRPALWQWLRGGDSYGRDYARLFGLVIESGEAPATVSKGADGGPAVEVHSVRPAMRRTLQGSTSIDLVIEITQRRDGYFDDEIQKRMDAGSTEKRQPDFIYRAGVTIVIDPATRDVRRVIRTAGTITDDFEMDRVRRFRMGEHDGGNAFDGGLGVSLQHEDRMDRYEPFALLHAAEEDQ
jgi:hypothetical protein